MKVYVVDLKRFKWAMGRIFLVAVVIGVCLFLMHRVSVLDARVAQVEQAQESSSAKYVRIVRTSPENCRVKEEVLVFCGEEK